MAGKNSPGSGIEICEEMDGIADQIDGMKTKFDNGITGKAIRADVGEARKRIKAIEGLMKQVGALVDEKNGYLKSLAKHRTKARQAVVGKFGNDSAEYQKVGGVRASERKKPGRVPKKAPVA